jgi:hypothetical protein
MSGFLLSEGKVRYFVRRTTVTLSGAPLSLAAFISRSHFVVTSAPLNISDMMALSV